MLLINLHNDDCRDYKMLSACSSKARQVHASDMRLFGVAKSRWLVTSYVNSLISIIG